MAPSGVSSNMPSKEVLELRIKHARQAIAVFRQQCEDAEYTDVGDVWLLLEAIDCGLCGSSPAGEMGDLKPQWEEPLRLDSVKLIEDWDRDLMLHDWPENGPGALKIEDLYQAFKVRMAHERRS